MQIKYVLHSCFTVMTRTCNYIFDYYKGQLPQLSADQPVIALFSHSHSDHFNPDLFKLLKQQGIKEIYAVLSDDIPASRIPGDVPVITVHPDNPYKLPQGQRLSVLASTDQGGAFLIQEPEGSLYHAGDLNDWVWEDESQDYNTSMTKEYRGQIDKLSGIQVDVAFLPLDPRQEKNYARGILYFLEKVNPKAVYPMHYWKKPQIIQQFIRDYPEYTSIIKFPE